jgi:hypothetical protein
MLSILFSAAAVLGAAVTGSVRLLASLSGEGKGKRRGRAIHGLRRPAADPVVWAVRVRTWGMRGWQVVELFDTKREALDFTRDLLAKAGVLDVQVKKM